MSATPTHLPRPFELERFFAKHEFSAPYLLCCSDCEALTLDELLSYADADSLDKWKSLKLGYTESQGLPALRAEVASLYTSVAPDDIMICCPEEGVYLAMKALLKPGDHVVSIRPGYQSLFELAMAAGCQVTFWEPEYEDGAPPTFSVASLKALVKQDTKLVVVNFPHNPTGATLSQADWRELVEVCHSSGAWLFSDEMYRHLELETTSQLPSAVDVYDKAMVLCGMSKSLSAPGLRLGWLACKQKELLQLLLQLKDYTTICASAPSEVLALMALRARERIFAANLDLIRANLEAADAFFQRQKETFEWHRQSAGPIVFPRVKTGEDVEAFCERVVAGCGVLLLPATVYHHKESIARGHFRMGLGRRNFAECLAALEKYLASQGGSKATS